MKKLIFLLALLGVVVGCNGSADDTSPCADGATRDADGNCPSGDDDAT